MIYLDYNATTPLLPQAREAMMDALDAPRNPSSMHGAGREARRRLEEARRVVAEAVSAWPNEIIFTGSGTEANDLALNGTAATQVFTSAVEHSSVLAARDAMRLPVDAQGLVSPEALRAALPSGAQPLVSIMLANNETGVIQPIRELAAIIHAAGGLLHVDAAQALGKIPVDMGQLGADMLTLCAHKFGGPVGAAALVVRQDLPLRARLLGGGQELRRRAGTENLAAIAGFATAVQAAPSLAEHRGWLDAMEAEILAAAPSARIAGKETARLPNTSCLSMPGVSSEVQMMHFDLGGVAISAGAACSSGRTEPSHVLQAMGWSREEAGSAIRVSTGWKTTEKDINALVSNWKALASRVAL